MKPTPFNFPLCILLLGMILGIIGQDLLNKIGIAMSLLLSGIAVGGIYYCHFRLKKFLKETVFLAGMSLGILAYNIHYEPNDSKHYLHKLSPEKAYSLVGRIEHIKNSTCFYLFSFVFVNSEFRYQILIGGSVLFATGF